MSLVNFYAKQDSSYIGNWAYQNYSFPNYFGVSYKNPFAIYKTNNINTENDVSDTVKISLKSGKIADLLEQAGYDSEKAKKLTKAAKKRARENGWRHSCAYEVRMSLEEAELIPRSNGNGDAYRYIALLSSNKNFREIDVSQLSSEDLIELSKFDGITYVYDRGKKAKYSKKHGHIEISLGNGTNGSDGITHHIKKGARVFIPVKTPYSAIA